MRNGRNEVESPKKRYPKKASIVVKASVFLRPILSESRPKNIPPTNIPIEKTEKATPFASDIGSGEIRQSSWISPCVKLSFNRSSGVRNCRTIVGSNGIISPIPRMSRKAVTRIILNGVRIFLGIERKI